ncbi:hypothetical protein [Falsiroseomonas oryziterrae]|uniref:hypothetical protein n=1 Tax=Falsiroseomonas oryziterrae TaxID=2911368 RepID=UPI001F18FEE5|nr:hypothetical protein [Roseomonas sp. NPKOSM-4]
MADKTAVQPELASVIARFPDREAMARYLFRTHPDFRSICEDYRLAADGVATFRKLAATAPRPELDEYLTLLRELEAELLSMFGAADAASPPAGDLRRPGGH